MSEHELWNELGNLYFMSGAYNQAVHAYNRSIQLNTEYGRPYSNLALAYVQQGKFEQAVDLYRRSLELLNDTREKAISWNRLGNVYRHLKDYREALVAYQQADELNPEISENRDQPGEMLYGSAHTPAPEPSAASMDPNSGPEPDQLPGSLAGPAPDEAQPVPEPVTLASSEPAVDTLSDAANEPPLSDPTAEEAAEAETVLAWFDPELSEPDRTSSTLDEGAELYFPELGSEAPLEEHGWLDEEQASEGELPEPEPAQDPQMGEWISGTVEIPVPYEQDQGVSYAIPAGSTDVSVWEEPARLLPQAQVDVEELPSPAFIVAAKHDPDLVDAQNVYEQTEPDARIIALNDQELQELEVEIAKFKRAVQVNPRNAYAWSTLGTLYKSAGLYQEAILAYQQAISIDPSKASYHYHLGLMYAAEGREEDAMLVFQRVVEMDPGHSLAHATLGGYYRKIGLEELAQKHIGKAMRSIYDSESEYNRACLEAICGNIDQAIGLLRVALENKQTYVDWVLRDPDLDTIRDDRRFKQLISDFTR